MTDYTPTTEQVRETYAALCKTDAAADEFDRWHADVIRKAKVKAWQEGYEAGCEDMENGGNATINPYTEKS